MFCRTYHTAAPSALWPSYVYSRPRRPLARASLAGEELSGRELDMLASARLASARLAAAAAKSMWFVWAGKQAGTGMRVMASLCEYEL